MHEPSDSASRSAARPCTDMRLIGTDADAFEAFYREHVHAIGRFVARRVADRELAADLTADVFMAAIDSAHTYRPRRGTPRAWLFGVARIVVVAEQRRRGRERGATGRLAGRRLLDSEDAARLDERIDAAAQSRRLYEAIARLPEGQRAVLELVAVDDLRLADAARVLGITPLAARVRLHRARRQMADRLAAGATQDPGRARHEADADRHDSAPTPRPQEASR